MPTSSMKPFPVVAPFKGVITDMPSGADAQAHDVAQNFLFRKSRIVTRPAIQQLFGGPVGQSIRGLYSFQDALENWHTLVLSNKQAFFMTNPSGSLIYNQLALPVGITDLGNSILPFSMIEMNQQLYFSNGGQNLMYVDGSNQVQLAGDANGGCQFLTENSSHLIGVNWNIPSPGVAGSQNSPFLVRISDAGDPTTWTPNIGNSATEINLIEKGGIPSGAVTLGTYTYVWRQFGANVLWPTGNFQAPFDNQPFSWSNPGWGNFYPYTISTWNDSCLMVAHNGEVLLYNGANGPTSSGFQPLASGKILKSLAADLAQATGDVVFGFITDQLGPGYDFNAYVIWIPGLNKAWVLNLVDMTWSWITSSTRYATAFANIKVH